MYTSTIAIVVAAEAYCVSAVPIIMDNSVAGKRMKSTLQNDLMSYHNMTVDEGALIRQSEARKALNIQRSVPTIAAHDASKKLTTHTDKPKRTFLEGEGRALFLGYQVE